MMEMFNLGWLTTIFNDVQESLNESLSIQEVTTDSRKETSNSLFIPIVGESFDGHDFIIQAIENGAVATIWRKDKQLPNKMPVNFPIFYVEDTISALQILAREYRNKINPTVIGITGSNGKTTTKDIVTTILKYKYNTHHTFGNLNNHIGVPLTILSMRPDTEMLVLEMGMNNFDEIDLLSRLAKPDYAIITNIGESHIEFLKSRSGIAKAKLEITHGLKNEGYLIIDGDEELLEHKSTGYNIINCGFNQTNDIIISEVIVQQTQTEFQLSTGANYSVPLLGEHHAKNASFGIAIGLQLGMKETEINEALQGLSVTGMRFEMIKGINGTSIINDAYNASPTSMKAAIEVVKALKGFQKKVLVLGDIFELGTYSKQLHESVETVIVPPISVVFTMGEEIKVVSEKIAKKESDIVHQHFKSADELIIALECYLNENTLILFKASRGMQFERLVERIAI